MHCVNGASPLVGLARCQPGGQGGQREPSHPPRVCTERIENVHGVVVHLVVGGDIQHRVQPIEQEVLGVMRERPGHPRGEVFSSLPQQAVLLFGAGAARLVVARTAGPADDCGAPLPCDSGVSGPAVALIGPGVRMGGEVDGRLDRL